MKKSVALLISILFVGLSSFSQTSLGISGGINFSGINGSFFPRGYESTLINNRMGMQMGMIFNYTLSESLSLYIDPSYIQKGFKYKNAEEISLGGANFKGENKFQYIQLPLSLKLSLFKNKIFYIRSGVYLSFLLDANLTDEYSYPVDPGNSTTEFTDEKVTNDLNSSTLGFALGTGAAIPLSSKLTLLIDAAYMMDVSNAMKDNPPNYYWGYKSSIYESVRSVRNRSFTISVGLAMEL